jgi:ABC-type branched-subunit amino acid transport system ATPase component
MSNTELLLKKVEGLPPSYMTQIFDFIDQLKNKAPPVEQNMESATPLTDRLWGILAATPENSNITKEQIREERLSKYL